MDHSEFVDRFKSIQVVLNWKKMAAEQWPISVETIRSAADLLALYMPMYALPDGTFVEHKTEGAAALTVERAVQELMQWSPESREIIRRYMATFERVMPPISEAFPAYKIPGDRRLLLDGNHRAAALILARVDFEIELVCIEGPISKDALLDLKYWQVVQHDSSGSDHA